MWDVRWRIHRRLLCEVGRLDAFVVDGLCANKCAVSLLWDWVDRRECRWMIAAIEHHESEPQPTAWFLYPS